MPLPQYATLKATYSVVATMGDSFKSWFVIPAKAGIQVRSDKLGFPPSRISANVIK